MNSNCVTGISESTQGKNKSALNVHIEFNLLNIASFLDRADIKELKIE